MTTKKSKAVEFLEAVTGGPLTLNGLLESLRLCEELSQVEFAKQLKISPSHLCDIEKGRKLVSPGRAAKFAKILGYSEIQFVRLALQGILDETGLKMEVNVKAR
jgi:transcriptional regulator with XRE-family HTH domain